VEEIGNLGLLAYWRACGADGLDSAPGKRFAHIRGRNEVWSLPLDSSLRHPYLPLSPKLPKANSSLTTVLRIVVPEPCLRHLLAFVQRHPFLVGQLPQPG